MHVAGQLKREMFRVSQADEPATISDILPDWNPLDRFGILIDSPLGGVGASHLIQIAIVAFYDAKPVRRTSGKVYPEIYAFHLGRGYGAHADFDIWPARREIVVTGDHRDVLDAVNDRGITRLAVPERPVRDLTHRPKEADAAIDRITSAFLYHPYGRIASSTFEIEGVHVNSDVNPWRVLDQLWTSKQTTPTSRRGRIVKEIDPAWIARHSAHAQDVREEDRAAAVDRRQQLGARGHVRESYHSISVESALERLYIHDS